MAAAASIECSLNMKQARFSLFLSLYVVLLSQALSFRVIIEHEYLREREVLCWLLPHGFPGETNHA